MLPARMYFDPALDSASFPRKHITVVVLSCCNTLRRTKPEKLSVVNNRALSNAVHSLRRGCDSPNFPSAAEKTPLFPVSLAWLGGWTLGHSNRTRAVTKIQSIACVLDVRLGLRCNDGYVCFVANGYGKDVLRVDLNILEVRKEVLGIRKLCSLLEIRELRFQPESGSGKGHRDSTLAFDDGATTITFADGIDEAEANHLIRVIADRYKIPQTPQGFPLARFRSTE